MKAIDNQSIDTINIALINDAPVGMVHAPLDGLGPNRVKNPVQQVVTWTPGCFQKGKHVLCYQATDDSEVQQLDSRVRCVIILVTELTNKRPYFCGPGTPNPNQQIPVCVGQIIRFTIDVCDDNKEDVVSIKFLSGVPANAVVTPEIAPQAYPNYGTERLKNHVKRTFNLDPQQSLEDGDICFEGVDQPPLGGVTTTSLSTGQRCVRLTVRYPPRFVEPTPLPDPSTGLNSRIIAKVCEEVTFKVTAEDKNKDIDEDVIIFVMEDPGVPNGAVVEDNVCPPPAMVDGVPTPVRCNPVSRTFRWTPAKGQEGKVYRVCFIARDNKNNCQDGGYFSQPRDNPCIDIEVFQPQPKWGGEGTGMPQNGRNFDAFVGCTHVHTLTCEDAEQAENTPGYSIEIANTTPLPQGASMSPCRGDPNAGEGANPSSVCKRNFSWKPARGQEGHRYSVCYSCFDVGCNAVLHDTVAAQGRNQMHLPSMNYTNLVCVNIHVVRCKYCVGEGDTLHYINKFYHLDTNWMRIWNANGNQVGTGHAAEPIHDPDMVLHDSQVINIGPIYRVQSGDNMVTMAARFHTTVKKIYAVNPDLDSSSTALRPGQELCILPCSDSPANHSQDSRYAW